MKLKPLMVALKRVTFPDPIYLMEYFPFVVLVWEMLLVVCLVVDEGY